MVTVDPNWSCRQAELYYYEFLCGECIGTIPDDVSDHIKQCGRCRGHIDRLKDALFESGEHSESGDEESGAAVVALLKLHFAYIGERITCQAVKPFLPTLSDPDLEIGIPTPITIHLDRCEQCADDLDIIRELHLGGKQLRRLSQIFAEKSFSGLVSCSEARKAIPSVASMDFREINGEVLKHLCTCRWCREVLYEERQKVCNSLSEDGQSSGFGCESVSAEDIFDYAIPYGIDPAKDEYAKFRKSFTSHATSCPRCLAEMQRLHNTVYDIAERAESNVVTIYHIDEFAKAQVLSESDDTYAAYPISVEVVEPEDEVKAGGAVSRIDFGEALKRKISGISLRPFVRVGAAAAAVIVIGAALLMNTPAAKAITIDEIYNAIAKIRNVYVAKFAAGREEPVLERWVSRTSKVYMTKTAEELVLWDIRNGVRKSRAEGSGGTETARLTDDVIMDMEGKIGGSLGLVPFYDVSEVPEGAEWVCVSEGELESVAAGAEVYDLRWAAKLADERVVSKKWRFFVDAETSIPQKTEVYLQLPGEEGYTLETVMAVQYLSDGEMEDVIRGSSL